MLNNIAIVLKSDRKNSCLIAKARWLIGLWLSTIATAAFSGTSIPNIYSDSPYVESHPQIQIAASLIDQAKTSQAIKALDQFLSASGKSINPIDRITALGLLSDCYLIEGSKQQALKLAQQAVALSQRLDNPAIQSKALNYLGNVNVAQGNNDEAEKNYQEGVLLAQQADDEQQQIHLLVNLAQIHVAENDMPMASETITKTLGKIERSEHPLKTYDLITIGHLTTSLLQKFHHQNDTSETLKKAAYQALSHAHTLASNANDPAAHSLASGYLGELYAHANRHSEAEQLLRSALFMAMENDYRYLSGRWQWQIARLLAKTNRKTDAIVSYYDAVNNLKDLQPFLLQGWRGHPRAFRDNIGEIYFELTQLLLAEAESAEDEASRRQALKNIRYIMEEYKAVEFKEYFQDSCAGEQFSKNQHIEIDSLISHGTAVLYPILFADQILLLLSLADGNIHSFSVPASRSDIEKEIEQFRAMMNPSSNPRKMLKLSASLYNKLIMPVKKQLDSHQVNHLVIVPEGVLRSIPFAALHSGEHYLVHDYALAISPGLLLTDNSKTENVSEHIFSGGLSESVQGFSRLPYVKKEMDSINELSRGKALLNEKFTKSRLIDELNHTSYDWVTLSTHGYIAQDFKQSYLLTYDQKLGFDELQDTLQSGGNLNRSIDLLVLSACETAVGNDRAALGLAGLTLKAGVKSTMASLWTVNDKYTAELIPEFLQGLKNGEVSKAQALQAAQLKVINDHHLSHPYYWAAFIIAGNWL